MWKLARDLIVEPLDCTWSTLHTKPNFIFISKTQQQLVVKKRTNWETPLKRQYSVPRFAFAHHGLYQGCPSRFQAAPCARLRSNPPEEATVPQTALMTARRLETAAVVVVDRWQSCRTMSTCEKKALQSEERGYILYFPRTVALSF